jgi:hypothetical protein
LVVVGVEEIKDRVVLMEAEVRVDLLVLLVLVEEVEISTPDLLIVVREEQHLNPDKRKLLEH